MPMAKGRGKRVHRRGGAPARARRAVPRADLQRRLHVAEQALGASEARFHSLTNLSSDWYWEQDAEHRFTKLEGRHVAGGDPQLLSSLIGRRRWEKIGRASCRERV